MTEKRTVVHVSGMTCTQCERSIVKAVRKLDGVLHVSASFPKRRAEVVYDADRVTEEQIREAIEKQGYKVSGERQAVTDVLSILIIILALYFILRNTVGLDFFNMIPQIDETVSLAALFVVGLLTSVHCIAMCGGINLSQSVGAGIEKKANLKRPLLYNLGRVASYTIIGGIVGGLGSVLFISSAVKGVIMVVAGVFMLLMSLSMLGWLPHWLVPRLPRAWSEKAGKASAGRTPFVVGLLNGLMPCGPLQAMQLYALSTGSVLMGALSMLLFSLGTVPLMLGAGLLFSMLKGKFTRVISRVSAVLVMLIAFVMLVNATGFFGWTLFPSDAGALAQAGPSQSGDTADRGVSADGYETVDGYTVAKLSDDYQEVAVDVQSSGYPPVIVQEGIPVKLNLRAAGNVINGCNGAIVIPQYNVQKTLQPGDNIVEFTPEGTGNVALTCWMSMIRSTIVVVDDLSAYSEAGGTADGPAASLPPAQQQAGGCCGF